MWAGQGAGVRIGANFLTGEVFQALQIKCRGLPHCELATDSSG